MNERRKPLPLRTAVLSFTTGIAVTTALMLAANLALRSADTRTGVSGTPSHLSLKHEQLEKTQGSAGRIVNLHRRSVVYIYGVYRVGGRGSAQTRTSFSGTGFVVADGMVATNRHIAEPWWDDVGIRARLKHGEQARIEKILAFFPDMVTPVALRNLRVSPDADIAVASFDSPGKGDIPPALPLAVAAPVPGDPVVVLGYPLGLMGMLAKAPRPTYRQLMKVPDDLALAQALARMSLIRPSATSGHLGDVLGDTLVYDAPTARGGSGAPVFNGNGEVIGITSAYMRGFSGGTLGISVNALRPLLQGNQPI
ncbi:MAG: serine protease [Acidobacteriales bacterium]|nr:serine protease [Terriglobales bacterium]